MRILIHTQYYPPEMGAPQARLSDLARRLKDLGHEIQVLTAFPNYPTGRIFDGYPRFYMNEEKDGICVHRSSILPSNNHSFFHRLATYLSFTISSLFVGLFKISKVDIVFTESPPLFLAVSGWLLARLKKARWVLNVSDLWPDSAKYIGMLSDRSLIYRVLEGMAHFLYRRAWLVTGQSKEIVAEIEQQVPSVKSYHLSNGVDLTAFNPQKRSEEIRKRFLRDGEIGFIYAGLHGFFQGLDQILLTAEKLKDEPVRFILVGDGPEKKRLAEMSEGLSLRNVTFLPPMPHEEVPSMLAPMDAAVISLKSTILGAVPSKIYEAMASGIPVLLVADGEARDIVTQADAGVTVAPGDTERLAAVVREMSSNPEWRRKMGQAGRKAVERLYDRGKIAERFDVALRGNGKIERQGAGEKINENWKRTTVHRVEGDKLLASQGYKMLRSSNGGKNWLEDGSIAVSWWRRVTESVPLFSRISRGGVSYVLPQRDGSRLCIVPKMILRAEAGSSDYRCVFGFSNGSHPLNLCQGPDGRVYWGEYFLNLRRSEPVRIFGSKDEGRTWEVVYTFAKGSICHVHRIVHDPYDDAFLVCTGDRDQEVSILRTDDGFRTLKPVVHGDQKYRTTSLIARPDCILYGTDSPNGENYVMALDRKNGSADKVQRLPGPVLYGCQVGDKIVFATMVEKQHHEVSLWVGNENGFSKVTHLKAKKWNRAVRELIGYPTAILPEGTSNWPNLYFTPVGTELYDGSLMCIDLSTVIRE